jgi:membrane protein
MRQVTNYVSVLVLIPLLLGVASTADIYIKTVTAWLPETMVGGAHKLLLTATTLGATWLALCALIRFVPNTAVHLMPAVISSLLTAFVFVGWQKLYIAMQIGVARFNAIYGTFAAIPIFLAWLYTSWVIILLGAELAFAIQNSATYEMEGAADKASFRARLTLALAIMRRAAMTTIGSQPPFTTDVFARENRVPIRLLNDIIRLLVRAGWLVRTAEPESAYVLVKAPSLITVREIVDTVLLDGTQSRQLGFSRLDDSVEPILKAVVGEMNTHLDQATLLSMVPSSPALSAHGS